MNTALRALNGFGLGARAGESQRVGDPRAWLRAQLRDGAALLRAPPGASAAEVAEAMRGFRNHDKSDKKGRQQLRRRLIGIAESEGAASLSERAGSNRPFVERMVAFWSNHLCVSTDSKSLVGPLAGSYEREAIRPHVLGRFEDMVLASARHPAMLLYLDNFRSIGPNSAGARRSKRPATARGLNENYARELLELHTLGVNGGYTQQDVQELAKILTGWTVDGLDTAGTIRFSFDTRFHEPGAKTLLGVRHAESGVAEGEQAIRTLCRHTSTARFIATKLVTHFVADEPPATAINVVESRFIDSGGDLGQVAAALIEIPEAWDGRRKFRSPQDWYVAAQRAFGATTIDANALQSLRQLRHPLWAPTAPKGFGDRLQDWADPNALLNRAELASTLARKARPCGIDSRSLVEVVDLEDNDPLRKFLADNSIAPDERVALVLAGPAFQWR